MLKEVKNKNLVIGILCAVILTFLFPYFASANEADDYDSVIIKPKAKLLKSKRMNRLMYRSGVSSYRVIKDDLYVVSLDANSTNEIKQAKIDELQKTGLFELVEPDYKFSLDQNPPEREYVRIIHLPVNSSTSETTTNIDNNSSSAGPSVKEVTPNDKDFSSQYYLREINATKAWNLTTGDSLLVVGVLDTGVDEKHPDLNGRISGGNPTVDLSDEIGHGTAVSGIVSANTNNNEGIAGISWNTKILSLMVTDENGQAKVSTVVSALDDAYKNGAMILQISLSTNQFSQTLKDAIQQAKERNILIIASAGNTGITEARYPAAFDGVIGVGAVEENKEIASYSTRGDHVELVAPGTNIYTTAPGSSYRKVSGTSFAAPQATGAAALVWSIAPSLTNKEVENILINSTDDLGIPGKDPDYGNGLLNIQKAVEMAKEKTGK